MIIVLCRLIHTHIVDIVLPSTGLETIILHQSNMTITFKRDIRKRDEWNVSMDVIVE